MPIMLDASAEDLREGVAAFAKTSECRRVGDSTNAVGDGGATFLSVDDDGVRGEGTWTVREGPSGRALEGIRGYWLDPRRGC